VPGAGQLKSFVRVELSLKGADLQKELGGGLPVTALDYMKSYHALRKHILEVAPAMKAIDVIDTDGFLAWLHRKDPRLVMPYFDRGGKGKSPSRRKKMREIARMGVTIGEDELPWAELLPEDRPPPQVQLFYPNDVKNVFHPGIKTHPVSPGMIFIPDENDTVHQRFVRQARYRCGLGSDKWGGIKPIPVDSKQLGRSEIA